MSLWQRLRRSRLVIEEDLPPWVTMENGRPRPQGGIEVLPNGMKVLDRQRILPIHMVPGDILSCTYTQDWTNTDTGRLIRRQVRELATHRVEEPRTIDTVVIVELDDGSLEALGLRSGLAGIFGESA